MILFVDTNVLLDVLQRRRHFFGPAAAVWDLCHRRQIAGHVAAISFDNIHYIVSKGGEQARGKEAVRLLRDTFEIVPVDAATINQAIDSPVSDFEDAIQYHCALRCGASHLITRNATDFPTGGPAVVSAADFLVAASERHRDVWTREHK